MKIKILLSALVFFSSCVLAKEVYVVNVNSLLAICRNPGLSKTNSTFQQYTPHAHLDPSCIWNMSNHQPFTLSWGQGDDEAFIGVLTHTDDKFARLVILTSDWGRGFVYNWYKYDALIPLGAKIQVPLSILYVKGDAAHPGPFNMVYDHYYDPEIQVKYDLLTALTYPEMIMLGSDWTDTLTALIPVG